ncbi:MAG: hypothetical protein RL748_2226 [Pseudomonadota bacterium]|jgi:glutaredoxin
MVEMLLYSRSYCHLCHDMEQALLNWQGQHPQHGFTYQVRDVDAEPAALLQYDELVPVLLARGDSSGEWQEICHYFLDTTRLQAFFVPVEP